jgi:hypothetical protein
LQIETFDVNLYKITKKLKNQTKMKRINNISTLNLAGYEAGYAYEGNFRVERAMVS